MGLLQTSSKGDRVHAQFEAERLLAMSLSTAERSWQGLAWEDNARIAETGHASAKSEPNDSAGDLWRS
ncbi:MAG: hypothetical protein QOH96_2968 [Blastocatellia bacterium]|jgi:hypothetical protein|nr:hypothetical protein [Blastocatellia bacterium]